MKVPSLTRCEASAPENSMPRNSIPGLKKQLRKNPIATLKKNRFDFCRDYFSQLGSLIAARNRSAGQKNSPNTDGTRDLLRWRNTTEIKAEMDASVTTNHLLLPHRTKEDRFLATDLATGFRFSRRQMQPETQRGPGGVSQAERGKSAMTEKRARNFILKGPLPYSCCSKKNALRSGCAILSRPGRRFHMNSLALINDLSGFAPSAVLIGEGQPADRFFTREEFVLLCNLMRNNNPPNEFLQVYCDSNGAPRFVKAKSPDVEKRITWAWDTITGRAKHKVAIGFYPWNDRGESRWAAMDFDAHDSGAARAKAFAVAAFQILNKCPQFSLILASSGSEGWHLFVFSEQFHPIAEWVRLLKRTADGIGAEIRSGVCEIFPNETRNGSRPHAIRAPGTWNPKTNQLGAIFFTSVAPLLQTKRKKEVSSFLYHSADGAKASQLNDSGSRAFYSGGYQNWPEQFAITQEGTRHAQLRALVYCIFRQVGRQVARLNADAQYRTTRLQPKATLAEHLEEFEQLWDWMTNQWRAELSDFEREVYARFGSPTERDLFRILMNFAHYARSKQLKDFPFPLQHVAQRLGVSFQYVSKLRQRLIDRLIIAQTQPAIANRSAARFQWCLLMDPSSD